MHTKLLSGNSLHGDKKRLFNETARIEIKSQIERNAYAYWTMSLSRVDTFKCLNVNPTIKKKKSNPSQAAVPTHPRVVRRPRLGNVTSRNYTIHHAYVARHS